jgi:hypothetical protein
LLRRPVLKSIPDFSNIHPSDLALPLRWAPQRGQIRMLFIEEACQVV